MSNNPKLIEQYNQQNWLKTAIGWGLFMWLLMEVLQWWKDLPSLFNGQFKVLALVWWLVGGLLYSATMHYFYHRRGKRPINSPHNSKN